MRAIQAAPSRADRDLVSRLRRKGFSRKEIGGVLGCAAHSVAYRLRAPHVDLVWDEHEGEARDLVAKIAKAPHARLVGAVYLAVLHEWLLAQAPDDVQEALKALNSLAGVSFNPAPVCRQITVPPAIEARPDWRKVLNLVAERDGLSPAALVSVRADRDVTVPRDEIWWILREMRRDDGTHWFSGPVIGKMFNRDHSSVYAGIKRHAARRVDVGLPPYTDGAS